MEGGTSPKFSTRREATDFSLLERERALLHHKCHHRSVPGDDLEQAACLFSTEIISLDALAAIAGRLAAPGRERFQDGDLPVMCDSQWDEAGICSSPTQGQESVTRGAGVRVGEGCLNQTPSMRRGQVFGVLTAGMARVLVTKGGKPAYTARVQICLFHICSSVRSKLLFPESSHLVAITTLPLVRGFMLKRRGKTGALRV